LYLAVCLIAVKDWAKPPSDHVDPYHLPIPDLRRCESWSSLPSLAAFAVRGRGSLFLRSGLFFRVRVCLTWFVVGVVGAATGQIILPKLYSHINVILHGGVSELMSLCACRLSDRQLGVQIWRDLFVSRCAASLRWRSGQGGFSRARMLVRRWLISYSSPTSSMGGGGSWSKKIWGRPQSTCYNDICLVVCSVPDHRLTKPHWR
jgi:hypothetical protein